MATSISLKKKSNLGSTLVKSVPITSYYFPTNFLESYVSSQFIIIIHDVIGCPKNPEDCTSRLNCRDARERQIGAVLDEV